MANPNSPLAIDNPFHLHHSYGPTIVLVNQPLLGASNYGSWSRAMLIALSAKNKEGFIDGTIEKPKPEEKNLSAAWKCNNDILTSWIMNSVSKDIAASIVYSGSAKSIWDELKNRFKQSNGPHIYQLRKELVTTHQGTLSVEAYYTKLKTIWQNLCDYRPAGECSCGGIKKLLEHSDSEFVMIFLMGLNESYASLRAQVLLMNPIPDITKVFSLLIQEEHQRSLSIYGNLFPNSVESVSEVTCLVERGN